MAAEPIGAILVVVVRDDQDKPVQLVLESYNAGDTRVPSHTVEWGDGLSWMSGWMEVGKTLFLRHGPLLR